MPNGAIDMVGQRLSMPAEAVPRRPRGSGALDTQVVRSLVYLSQAALDLLALGLGFTIADYLRHGVVGVTVDATLFAVGGPIFLLVSFYSGVYSYETAMSAGRAVGRMATALAVTLALNLLVVFAAKESADISRAVFFMGAGISFVLLAATRLPITWVVRDVVGKRFMRRVLVVDGRAVDLPATFELIDAERIGLVPDVHNPIMLHNFSSLIAGADRVIVSCPPERRERWSVYLKGAGCWGELLVPELHGVAPLHDEPDLGLVGIQVSAGPLSLRNRVIKRMLDLALSVPVIVLLTPIFLVVAIAIKLDSRGPVLFRQRRMGRGNRLFDVYKFRSMRVELADSDGARSASRGDDRITRVGRFIRATSIDELPQLFNVLEGDMSLVGPRPHALGSLAGSQLFWQIDQRYWLRHAIKPGITGLAQVRGYRGATDHEDDLANRLRCDLEYVANWTLVRDLTILIRTALVLVHKNAY
ncbi:MAG TPA: sugar transferase [Sphingomonas sp.]|uniref:sugar transferase n=1 Tax=Sphingomonas sp. TaxID=28214 RepID=UPI002EDA701D